MCSLVYIVRRKTNQKDSNVFRKKNDFEIFLPSSFIENKILTNTSILTPTNSTQYPPTQPPIFWSKFSKSDVWILWSSNSCFYRQRFRIRKLNQRSQHLELLWNCPWSQLQLLQILMIWKKHFLSQPWNLQSLKTRFLKPLFPLPLPRNPLKWHLKFLQKSMQQLQKKCQVKFLINRIKKKNPSNTLILMRGVNGREAEGAIAPPSPRLGLVPTKFW